jgi:WD40 repeat protein
MTEPTTPVPGIFVNYRRQDTRHIAARRRRLEDSNDFVRLEIEAALRHDALVIPMLIDGTTMPAPQELPGELAQLAGRNVCSLDDQTFDADTDRLLTAIDQVLHPPPPVEPSSRADPSPAANWDSETGERLHPPLGHDHEVFAVASSPDGRWLATAGARRCSYGIPAPASNWAPLIHENVVWAVAFSQDSQRLAAGTSANLAML